MVAGKVSLSESRSSSSIAAAVAAAVAAAAQEQKEASKNKAFKDAMFAYALALRFCYVHPAPVVFEAREGNSLRRHLGVQKQIPYILYI